MITRLCICGPVEIQPFEPPDPEAVGVSRRQFFNRATVTLMAVGIGAFAAVAGLLQRENSGEGLHLDAAQFESAMEMMDVRSGAWVAWSGV